MSAPKEETPAAIALTGMLCIVFVCAVLFAPPVSLAAFDENAYARFNNTNIEFFRLLYACPVDATSFDECRPKQGVFDARKWKKLQRDAEVFR